MKIIKFIIIIILYVGLVIGGVLLTAPKKEVSVSADAYKITMLEDYVKVFSYYFRMEDNYEDFEQYLKDYHPDLYDYFLEYEEVNR